MTYSSGQYGVHCWWELVKLVDFAAMKIIDLDSSLDLAGICWMSFGNFGIQEVVQASMLRLYNR
jgi:hypothetical protein